MHPAVGTENLGRLSQLLKHILKKQDVSVVMAEQYLDFFFPFGGKHKFHTNF